MDIDAPEDQKTNHGTLKRKDPVEELVEVRELSIIIKILNTYHFHI